jgi:hypothetical protein
LAMMNSVCLFNPKVSTMSPVPPPACVTSNTLSAALKKNETSSVEFPLTASPLMETFWSSVMAAEWSIRTE